MNEPAKNKWTLSVLFRTAFFGLLVVGCLIAAIMMIRVQSRMSETLKSLESELATANDQIATLQSRKNEVDERYLMYVEHDYPILLTPSTYKAQNYAQRQRLIKTTIRQLHDSRFDVQEEAAERVLLLRHVMVTDSKCFLAEASDEDLREIFLQLIRIRNGSDRKLASLCDMTLQMFSSNGQLVQDFPKGWFAPCMLPSSADKWSQP
ncbi:hypothetical protein GC197_17285 [bacterium]|nr:hypothetical protein [bacterium]